MKPKSNLRKPIKPYVSHGDRFDKPANDNVENNTYGKNRIDKEPNLTQNLVLTVEKLGNDLEGVAYVKGVRYLVKGALAGETVSVDVIEKSGNIRICRLNEIIKRSPDRIKSPCEYSDSCGACSFDYLSPEKQRKLKTDLIKRRLNEFRDKVQDIAYVENSVRNKIHLVFKGEGKGIEIGFFNSETHKTVNVESCLMHDREKFSAIRSSLASWCEKYRITAYNPHRQRGNLRFAVVRILNDALSISLVFYKRVDDGLSYLYSLLKNSFDFVSLSVNVNDQISNSVFNGDPVLFLGEKELSGELSGVKFYYSAGDFLQTNTDVCRLIYDRVVDTLLSEKIEKIVDAYSGIGITSTLFAKNGIDVTSVEISPSAVESAKKTAQLNGVKNIVFYQGNFEDIIENIETDKDTAIFVDPPRAGLGKRVCESIISKSFKTVLYLSCEPDTLVRDLKDLSTEYSVEFIRPYDMFPSTKHVETVCLLSRNK